MFTDSASKSTKSKHGRSAMSNGTRLLDGIDGRTIAGRRYRDLAIALADDLGGVDHLGEADKALVRQAAALTVKSEAMQAAIVNGDAVDDEQLVRVTNALTRALTTIRRKTKAKPPGPNLADYLEGRAA